MLAAVLASREPLEEQVPLEATFGSDDDVYQTFWLWRVDFRDIERPAYMLRELVA